MSPQHDYVIDNSTGQNVRLDINSALQAIATNNSGSSAPSTTYALQLFADSSLQKLRIRNSGNNAYVNLRGFDGSIEISGGSQSSPSLSITDDTNTGIFSGGPDEINISTGGTERFVITNTGKCGIGTVNPAGNLHIQSTGDTVIRATSADGNGAFLDLGDVSDPDGGRINYDSGNNLIFHTSSQERFRIDQNGNVGIGAIPDKDFHVERNDTNTSAIAKFKNAGTGDATLQIGTAATNFVLGMDNSDSDSFKLGFGSALESMTGLTIDSSGNVSVGGTSPSTQSAKFQTTGNSQNATRINMHHESNSSASISANGGLIFGSDTSNGTTQRMLIDTSGNIGAPSGTNIFNASDSRVKTNVVNLEKGLSDIKSLRPVSFNWIDGFCDEEKNTLYGFIAQEVQTVDSNLIQDFSQEITVKDTKIENVLRVNEKFIIPMLVKAIQELSAKVEALEAG